MAVARPREAALWSPDDQSFGRLEILVQVVIELLQEFVAHGHEGRARVQDQHQAQDEGVPRGESNPNRRNQPRAHGSPSFSTNPTPRIV